MLVNVHGHSVTRQALSTLWQTFILDMVARALITDNQRFGMHDNKRKAINGTKDNRADNQEAGGNRTQSTVDVYDLSMPHVTTPGDVRNGDSFYGYFYG